MISIIGLTKIGEIIHFGERFTALFLPDSFPTSAPKLYLSFSIIHYSLSFDLSPSLIYSFLRFPLHSFRNFVELLNELGITDFPQIFKEFRRIFTPMWVTDATIYLRLRCVSINLLINASCSKAKWVCL